MNDFFRESVYAGAVLSIFTYMIGVRIQKKLKLALFNPLLISYILVIAFLVIFRVEYDSFLQSARYIHFFLTPTTVCLAIPLYEKYELLRKNKIAILAGVLAGTLSALLSVFLLSLLFRLDHASYVTMLPKSVTTAIGMGLSEELGGYVPITVASIVVTGLSGNIMAKWVCQAFRITDPVARGVAIGTASHAMGTAKALEMGKTEGAMSGLAIVVAGLLTVVGANLFSGLI